eukprot:IDg23542t1
MTIGIQEAAAIRVEFLLRKHQDSSRDSSTLLSADEKLHIIANVRGVAFEEINLTLISMRNFEGIS